MSYQQLLDANGVGAEAANGEVCTLEHAKGSVFMGTLVNAPFALHKQVYIVPMETVLATKVRHILSLT